jgi:ankyrin repeat protein
LQVLLDHNTDVTDDGDTLHDASYNGHDGVIRILLTYGVDVNIQRQPHGSALIAASQQGHNTTVQLLLDSGADINLQGEANNENALWVAISNMHKSTVRILLKHGAEFKVYIKGFGNTCNVSLRERDIFKSIMQILWEYDIEMSK